MYSVGDYGHMIAKGVRVDAYAQALRQAIRPGSVVLDIGTGTGFFAMLACRFGARCVFAVEPDDIIQVARETAAANGYIDRIQFIQDLSTRVSLPEQANVVISDIRGRLPLFQRHILTIADARRRLLAPGGVLIPQRDCMWAAVVEAPEQYSRQVEPWDEVSFGLDLNPSRRFTVNSWCKGKSTKEQLLVEPQCWATMDYTTIEDPDVSGHATWTVQRSGTGHGLNVWFDTTLAEGVGFSNAPGQPELIYGTTFFPWSSPVSLDIGDTIEVALHADLVDEDYVWRWDTRILDEREQTKANFRQSTFYAAPLSPVRLRKRADSYVPALTEDGEIDRFILSVIDGRIALGDIARRVEDRFPGRFAKWQDALTRVGELSQKYSR
jgi:type I protein arginine methyltransferase